MHEMMFERGSTRGDSRPGRGGDTLYRKATQKRGIPHDGIVCHEDPYQELEETPSSTAEERP